MTLANFSIQSSYRYDNYVTSNTGGWRKLHNEELRNLYPSPSIIRIMKLRRIDGQDM
jgi:hypothetical protein